MVLDFSHRLARGFDVLRLPEGSESRNYILGNIITNKNTDKRSKKSLFDFSSKLAKTILNSLSAKEQLVAPDSFNKENNIGGNEKEKKMRRIRWSLYYTRELKKKIIGTELNCRYITK